MEKVVELNGMKRSLFGEKEIKIYERTADKIKIVERYLTNLFVDFKGTEIIYSFGTDERNIDSNFELKFILRDGLEIAELNTTWSNQYITDEFIGLARVLNDIKNKFNKESKNMNKVDWNYFDKFENIIDKYMESRGEGNTKASQLVTAINKLIYKWYNDGDVFDNTCYLTGWANDLSSYANWIANNIEGAEDILDQVFISRNDEDYEELLKNLADKYLNENILTELNKVEKVDSIYKAEGKYEFNEYNEDDEDEEWF